MTANRLFQSLRFGKEPKADNDSQQRQHKATQKDEKRRKLCDVCNRVDFVAFFTSTQQIELCKFSHVFKCRTCPFCKSIASTVHNLVHGQPVFKEGTLKLVSRNLSPEAYPRASGIELFYRLEISLIGPSGPRAVLANFEICGGPPKALSQGARMVRVPLKEKFDPSTLKRWLEKSDGPTRRLQTAKTSRSGAIEAIAHIRKLRGVDVYSGDIVVLGSEQRYIALSYVWGKVDSHAARPPYPAITDQDHGVLCSISLDEQPRTIQDAASMIRQLGERYLWVDALCISQGDADDKRILVSNMDTIYLNAYFTIVAADGADANAGLQRLHEDSHTAEIPVHISSGEKHIALLPARSGYNDVLPNTIWNTRGWTYQEMILSTRSLVFTPTEVFFNTFATRERETYVLDEIPSITLDKEKRQPKMLESMQQFLLRDYWDVTPGNLQIQYKKAVQEYTIRSLSYDGDRLDAFLGVLNVFLGLAEKQKEAKTLGGVVQLEPALQAFFMWEICGSSARIVQDKWKTRVLPSWGWVGWSGAVTFPPSNHYPLHAVVMDEANVKLLPDRTSDSAEKWPFEPAPEPVRLSPTQGIVLHMWAPIIRCRLALTELRLHEGAPPQESQAYYSLTPTILEFLIDLGNTILLDRSLVSGTDPRTLHEFVGVGSYSWRTRQWQGRLIPFKRSADGEFVERMAPTMTSEVRFKDCSEAELNYCHVKML